MAEVWTKTKVQIFNNKSDQSLKQLTSHCEFCSAAVFKSKSEVIF